jgi:hypothetical protein
VLEYPSRTYDAALVLENSLSRIPHSSPVTPKRAARRGPADETARSLRAVGLTNLGPVVNVITVHGLGR